MLKHLALLFFSTALAITAHAEDGKSVFVGGKVTIDQAVAGSVHAAGGHISLEAPVGGDARFAGGKIRIAPDAVIKGNLRAAGGKITIDGAVGGDVSVAGGSLSLGPNARIGGKLRFRGGHLHQDEGAQVAGGIDHVARNRHREEFTPFARSVGGWVWTLGLMVLAAVIAAALPSASNRMADQMRANPWRVPLLGLVALVLIPIGAVLVMITVIGIPLALVALLGYVALLILGYVCASVVGGKMFLEQVKPELAAHRGWRALAAVIAMLLIALVARVPFVGGLTVFVALIVGIGLVVAASIHGVRSTSAASPAAV
jgi:hypothetical protein